jgi:hypothetical protein
VIFLILVLSDKKDKARHPYVEKVPQHSQKNLTSMRRSTQDRSRDLITQHEESKPSTPQTENKPKTSSQDDLSTHKKDLESQESQSDISLLIETTTTDESSQSSAQSCEGLPLTSDLIEKKESLPLRNKKKKILEATRTENLSTLFTKAQTLPQIQTPAQREKKKATKENKAQTTPKEKKPQTTPKETNSKKNEKEMSSKSNNIPQIYTENPHPIKDTARSAKDKINEMKKHIYNRFPSYPQMEEDSLFVAQQREEDRANEVSNFFGTNLSRNDRGVKTSQLSREDKFASSPVAPILSQSSMHQLSSHRHSDSSDLQPPSLERFSYKRLSQSLTSSNDERHENNAQPENIEKVPSNFSPLESPSANPTSNRPKYEARMRIKSRIEVSTNEKVSLSAPSLVLTPSSPQTECLLLSTPSPIGDRSRVNSRLRIRPRSERFDMSPSQELIPNLGEGEEIAQPRSSTLTELEMPSVRPIHRKSTDV